MRLGFAVKVLGESGLRSHDTRRWQNQPHLSVSLVYLRDIFGYLRRQGISMYRMASQLAPYLTHPEHKAWLLLDGQEPRDCLGYVWVYAGALLLLLLTGAYVLRARRHRDTVRAAIMQG